MLRQVGNFFTIFFFESSFHELDQWQASAKPHEEFISVWIFLEGNALSFSLPGDKNEKRKLSSVRCNFYSSLSCHIALERFIGINAKCFFFNFFFSEVISCENSAFAQNIDLMNENLVDVDQTLRLLRKGSLKSIVTLLA